ncbi:hypothetical protein BDB00DRAFT_869847 [Zychaea mexicana]|uniref:uncharacterized protein n=1 Tax=Zychaea mexicana TaxID=64656 RepID=UPI0022FDF2BE|nr:uncharacterized protein BDB00DRAFT_869847 [Zychaea mexicana]KAI9495932.1 hypothetical protein BDB00DRAFT_869847 [Zychaea mexicana]
MTLYYKTKFNIILSDQLQLTESQSTAQQQQNNSQNQEPSSLRQRQESSNNQEQSSSQQHLNDSDCITSLTKRCSSTRAEDRYLEMELLDPKDLSFPPMNHDNHFVAQQFNVTNTIYKFQYSILQQKWKLTIEDHIHHGGPAMVMMNLMRSSNPSWLIS